MRRDQVECGEDRTVHKDIGPIADSDFETIAITIQSCYFLKLSICTPRQSQFVLRCRTAWA